MESSSSSSSPIIQMGEDMISSLPDCLIHEIFKFMDTEQVIATSLLSTRWTSLWQSNPYLNFIYSNTWETITVVTVSDSDSDSDSLEEEEEEKEEDGENYSNNNRFDNFVDRVLLSRNHSSALKTFCIKRYPAVTSPSVDSPPNKVDEWVGYAVSRNVQQVTLESVRMNSSTVQTLCENVKCLVLDYVRILLKEETEELLLNCPIMETLVLHSHCFYYNNPHRGIPYPNIKLSAPNLKVLKFRGEMSNNYTIENLSSIVTADICIYIRLKKDDRADFLDNILEGITNAPNLKVLKACSTVPITLNTEATFQSLRHLKLTAWWHMYQSIFCFSTILKLLQKSPNVETLVLDGNLSWEPEIMEEDLVAELQSWCRLCHLKTLEIEGWRIAINDYAFKFIKCIMENATSLKNVIITTTDTSEEQKKLVNICKKLKVNPKVTNVSSERIGVSLKPSIKIQWESA